MRFLLFWRLVLVVRWCLSASQTLSSPGKGGPHRTNYKNNYFMKTIILIVFFFMFVCVFVCLFEIKDEDVYNLKAKGAFQLKWKWFFIELEMLKVLINFMLVFFDGNREWTQRYRWFTSNYFKGLTLKYSSLKFG